MVHHTIGVVTMEEKRVDMVGVESTSDQLGTKRFLMYVAEPKLKIIEK